MSTVFSTPSDLEVAATRTYAAPRALVWECFTNPAHVAQWMLGPDSWTMPVCEIDLRVGGTWRYVWRKASGAEMEMRGRYLEVNAPERLVSTERWGPEWPETVNTLLLTEADGVTTMRNTVRYPSKADRDRAMTTGMEDGWGRSLERLVEYIATLR